MLVALDVLQPDKPSLSAAVVIALDALAAAGRRFFAENNSPKH